MHRYRISIALCIIALIGHALVPRTYAEQSTFSSEWGGHLRAIGTLSYPGTQSIYQLTDTNPFYDHQGELRLKHQAFIGSRWALQTHYESVEQSGATIKNNNRLRTLLPVQTPARLLSGNIIVDDRRVMNLTRILDERNDQVIYHRLDRLNLTYTLSRGAVRLGRQALTWGNGLIFNPTDIFNPFAPTSIQRDYKVGDDMLHLQLYAGEGEIQGLYLPRRNLRTGDVDNDEASFAGKWHFPMGAIEIDLIAAQHYSDLILGIGATGYLGGAAWRSDLIYTRLEDEASPSHFWQAVVNLDYSWQWGGKNLYGLVELYHNGLGQDGDYDRTLFDPAIRRRLERGELFTLGRTYLAGRLQVETHPLWLASATTIVNVSDPSAIFQPQLIGDLATNCQLIIGANFNWGADNTEFGGYEVPFGTSTIKVAPSQSRYLWLTYYF